jgi:hypothetical protein
LFFIIVVVVEAINFSDGFNDDSCRFFNGDFNEDFFGFFFGD